MLCLLLTPTHTSVTCMWRVSHTEWVVACLVDVIVRGYHAKISGQQLLERSFRVSDRTETSLIHLLMALMRGRVVIDHVPRIISAPSQTRPHSMNTQECKNILTFWQGLELRDLQCQEMVDFVEACNLSYQSIVPSSSCISKYLLKVVLLYSLKTGILPTITGW